MSGRYLFDIETDGLLPELTKLHCLVIKDIDTGTVLDYADQPGKKPIKEGVKLLRDASLLAGHNIIGFDLPALEKVYGFKTNALIRDTLVLTRLMWPHIKDSDYARAKANRLPKKRIGSHALEAWGYRLGILKDEYKGGWEAWSEEMHSYCIQDVQVTSTLWARIENEAKAWGVPLTDPNPPPRKDCIELEHRVAAIVEKVQAHGFRVDLSRIYALHAKLQARKAELVTELERTFPPEIVETIFIPKVNNKARGYEKGVPFVKCQEVPFNPSSRQMIAKRLQALGWKPKEFGKDGTPTVDDEILQSLPYPEAKILSEYFVVEKRIGQIASGKEAWLRHEKNGRIHGRIHAGGAHTGRMTHSNPNMAQVPGNHAPYGEECRDVFIADEGMVLVGCDADALELRDLAGYMAAWDDGAYIETVLRGDKAKGTDMHTLNALAIKCSRDNAKVFFYAMIYGAGDGKLGEVLGGGSREGRVARDNLMRGVPALGALVKEVAKKIERKGYIVGLDGRRLHVRSANAALNTLLQSAGAVQMKRALVLLYDGLIEAGWEWGKDFAIVALVHDEWQTNVRKELVEEFKKIAPQAIRNAGSYYSFKCPLDGQAVDGPSWRYTH